MKQDFQPVKYTVEEALEYHRAHRGKISVVYKTPVENRKHLSMAYTPGVAEPCKVIEKEPDRVYEFTDKGNMVAVVTDGSAVLGLGNIGATAGLPVMEGKAVLFKRFSGVDAFPICLNTQDPDEIVRITTMLEPAFGGINLEDISAPRCFEIEERLKKEMNIPIFHDDQHGTAIITLAGILNALKLTGKNIEDVKIVINGAGAAGIANAKILLSVGAQHITLVDSRGILYPGRKDGMNPYKEQMAQITNPGGMSGKLADAMKGADVFIGVSVANLVSQDMVRSMADEPIMFPMANPVPEIMPDLAKEAGARVVGTGRSDYPNQVNNVMGFPGIFRGALDVRATDINEAMKLAAAHALADLVDDDKLAEDYVIPSPLDPRVVPHVAVAVARAAISSGVARKKKVDEFEIFQNITKRSGGISEE